MKAISAITISLASLLSACSTNYLNYQGGQIMQGRGGACKTINGVDIWMDGSPPRKFRIIGVMNDSRPGGPLYMAARSGKIASEVRQRGGDAAIVAGDERQFMGTFNTGSSFSTVNASAYRTSYGANAYASGTTVGSSTSIAAYRAHSKYYVLKYVQ